MECYRTKLDPESLIKFDADEFVAILSWPGNVLVALNTWSIWDDEARAGRDLLHRSRPLLPSSHRRHVTMWSSMPRTVSRAQRTCDWRRKRNLLQLGALTETDTERASSTSIHQSIHPSLSRTVSSLPPIIARHGLHGRHVQDLPLLPQHGLLGKSKRGPVHLQDKYMIRFILWIPNNAFFCSLIPRLRCLHSVAVNWQPGPKLRTQV